MIKNMSMLVLLIALLSLLGCDEESIPERTGKMKYVDVDCKFFIHRSQQSNVTRIIDSEYGYIIYITNGGITAVPLTEKRN